MNHDHANDAVRTFSGQRSRATRRTFFSARESLAGTESQKELLLRQATRRRLFLQTVP